MSVFRLRTQAPRSVPALLLLLLIGLSSVKADKSAPGLDGTKSYANNFDDINSILHLQEDPDYKHAMSQIISLGQRPFFGENGYITRSFLASTRLKTNLQQESSNDISGFDHLNDGFDEMDSVIESYQVTVDPALGNLTTNATSNVTTDTTVTSSTNASTTVTTSLPVTVSPSPIGQTKCVKDLELMVESLFRGEQWALQMIDAWGKPGPSLLEARLNWVGTYKQCRNVRAPVSAEGDSGGFDGNYCVAMIIPGGSANKTVDPRILMMGMIQIGTCMPDSCSQLEITEIFNMILELIPKGNSSNSSGLLAYATDCRTDEREFTTASIFAIIFLTIIGIMMILGTAYDIAVIQWPKWYESWMGSSSGLLGGIDESRPNGNIYHSNNYQNGGYHQIPGEEHTGDGPVKDAEARPLLAKKEQSYAGNQGQSICGKTLVAFSVYTNGSKILSTAQPPGSLTAINGIRFLSMTWVILGHVYVFGINDLENIASALPGMLDTWTFDAISNALFSVDTFFTLSGLLTSYVTIKEMAKKGWKINWGMFYFHRFWRLTPPYMLVLLIALGLQRFMGSGALWPSTQPQDKLYCEENWWTNLLYINNIVKNEKMCLGHSWYLANDMQFFIVSPLMLIPFCFNKFAGIISCLIFLLAQWLTAGIMSTENKWAVSLVSGLDPVMGNGDHTLNWMTYYYFAPYCRIGPFVIGILAGYLLATTNGKIKMKWPVVLIGWIVSIAVGLGLVYGIHGSLSGKDPLGTGVSAFYNAVGRSAWGACVCWVIIACVSGYGGPVNTLLSWAPFGPLGRMTYMAYLIHPSILYIFFGNMEKLFFVNTTNIIFLFLGVLFFTYMTSFVFMLGLESPMIGLEKVFLGKFKR